MSTNFHSTTLQSVDSLREDNRRAAAAIQDLEHEREVLQKQALQQGQALEEQKSAADRYQKDQQQAMVELGERDRDLRVQARGLVEHALGEMLSVRRELEDTARAVEIKEAAQAALQAQAAAQEREGAELREAQAQQAQAEAEEACKALRDELEQERARCRALEDEVQQQQEALAQLQNAAKCRSSLEDDGAAGPVNDHCRSMGEAALSSVPEEDQTPADLAPCGALPSLAAVWARLNPGALAGSSAAAAVKSEADAKPPAPTLFPGPSGADIVIRPKGESSWKVVRPPLENAEDALRREKLLVHRTLEVIAQLSDKQHQNQEQNDKENLSPSNAEAGGQEEARRTSKQEAGAVASAGHVKARAGAEAGAASLVGAQEVAQRSGGGGWNKVRQFLRPDTIADGTGGGSPAPFKSESVLKRLSELRSSLQRPTTPVK